MDREALKRKGKFLLSVLDGAILLRKVEVLLPELAPLFKDQTFEKRASVIKQSELVSVDMIRDLITINFIINMKYPEVTSAYYKNLGLGHNFDRLADFIEFFEKGLVYDEKNYLTWRKNILGKK